MQWIKHTNSSMAWHSIFGESLPKKTSIDMAILRGNTILIRAFGPLEGMTYPEKWSKNSFNSFEFEILINDVNSVHVENYFLFGYFTLWADLPNITVEAENGCLLKCQAKSLSIVNIRGFYDEQI